MKNCKLIVALTVVVLGVWILAGCGATQEERSASVARLLVLKDQAKATLAATTQQVAILKADLEALPPGETRDKVLAALNKQLANADVGAKVIADVEKAVAAAISGDPVAIAAAASAIPGVGPYAGIAAVLLTSAYGLYQKLQAQKNLQNMTNVVKSLEVAGPEWSEEDKAAIKTAQGAATSLAVEKIKLSS